MKITSELQKVWDAVPEELKSHPDYCFQCGNDWEEIPETFNGKRVEVYNSGFIGNQRIYFAPTFTVDLPIYEMQIDDNSGVECIKLTNNPDCGIAGVTFKTKL
jgi:hypothetical protein